MQRNTLRKMKAEKRKITLKEARETDQVEEFIRQHSKEIAEDEAFIKLLEKMERGDKSKGNNNA